MSLSFFTFILFVLSIILKKAKSIVPTIANSLDSNGKKIEISFDKKNEYFRIYEDTDIKYKICLDIKREIVKKDTFNDYIYTINITVQLEDKYFSKKITEINNVKILGIGKNQSS